MSARRAGFSVVETLVAVTILVIAITGTVWLFRHSRRSFEASDEKMGALQAGRMLLERLKRDLRSLLPDDGKGGPAYEAGDGTLTLLRASGDATERVTYRRGPGGVVERLTDRGPGSTFGGDGTIVKTFRVRPRAYEADWKRSTGFAVSIEIVDASGNEKSALTLRDVIFPPVLREATLVDWVD